MTQSIANDLLSAVCSPALLCSASGTLVALNRPAADWLEIQGTVVTGQPISAFLCTQDESLEDFLLRAKRLGQACYHGPLRRIAKQTRQSTMLCHAQSLQGLQSSAKILMTFSVVEPVSEFASRAECHTLSRDALSGQRTTSTCLEGRADGNDMDALSDVALGLVHEVNQPLTAISTYAHSCQRWLQSGMAEPSKLSTTLDKIVEQVQVTGQMINSLKGLIRGQDDERSACDLNQLVSESLELLAIDARLTQCRIETRLGAEPCPIVVNAVQIKIVLLNLLRNAVEASVAFGASQPRIRVTVTSDTTSWASATVTDSGAGVPVASGDSLFQPFVTSKANGLGLGLVVSRCLALAHAGVLEHRPDSQHGASFQLRLPLAR